MILLVIGVAVTACESPAGNDGPQGPKGPEGPIGPAGDDGSMMYAGAGEPTDDIGDLGDYYLNQITGELHGPKDDDGWGGPIIVLMGDNGQDGTQIHSDDGAPDDSMGVIGDFILMLRTRIFMVLKQTAGGEIPLISMAKTDRTGQMGRMAVKFWPVMVLRMFL